MSESKKYNTCPKCYGTGICYSKDPVTNEPITEDPCVNCSGLGFFEDGKIDTTDIMAELDYIHGKVKAIWNKVKDKEDKDYEDIEEIKSIQ